MISHTWMDVYDLSITKLDDIKDGDLRNVKFLPGEIVRVKDKATGEIIELDTKDVWSYKHTIFIEGKEMRILNRNTRLDDPNNPLPSSAKLPDVDPTTVEQSKRKKKDPRD